MRLTELFIYRNFEAVQAPGVRQACWSPGSAALRASLTFKRANGAGLAGHPVLATSNGHPAHLTPTPLACSALRRVPTGLPPTGCHQGLSKIEPNRAKTSKACSGLGRLSQDL